VLVEQVVADDGLSEEIGLPQRRLLAMPREQIEELGLQRGAGAVGIEISDERILGFLEDDGGVETRTQTLGQRGLAGADGSFDGDGAETPAGPMISFAP